MTTPKRKAIPRPNVPELEFDVTQEIDPALADLLRQGQEPTLTQTDFADLEIEPPRGRTTRGR